MLAMPETLGLPEILEILARMVSVVLVVLVASLATPARKELQVILVQMV